MIDMPKETLLNRKAKTTLDEIINELDEVLREHSKAKCDPYVLQVGDITPRIRAILEDLKAVRHQYIVNGASHYDLVDEECQ